MKSYHSEKGWRGSWLVPSTSFSVRMHDHTRSEAAADSELMAEISESCFGRHFSSLRSDCTHTYSHLRVVRPWRLKPELPLGWTVHQYWRPARGKRSLEESECNDTHCKWRDRWESLARESLAMRRKDPWMKHSMIRFCRQRACWTLEDLAARRGPSQATLHKRGSKSVENTGIKVTYQQNIEDYMPFQGFLT